MVFSSIIFLYYFLPIVIIGYYLTPHKMKNLFFLMASLFFYAWGEPTFVFILMGSIGFNYLIGAALDRSMNRKAWLALGCVGNLLLLGIFKYFNFLIDNINTIFSVDIIAPTIALPLGISFFTFQAMSYIIDVYRGEAAAQKNYLNLAMYITAFPQLVAGPIVRYTTIMEQIDGRRCNSRQMANGTIRFLAGLSKKVIISNPLGLLVDDLLLDHSFSFTTAAAWIGIIAYTLQIYFDFSGYSDMAIGLGKMFGFEFEENFNYPYISKSVSEFWRRWHISLSSFFRDYLYIPMGGSRVSKWKNIRNLMIVWFFTGMWHGAQWTFIVWGVYYGVLIILEKNCMSFMDRIPGFVRQVYTLFCVMIGWVFFRAASMGDAFRYFRIMFHMGQSRLWDSAAALMLHDNLLILCVAVIGCTPVINRYVKQLFSYECEERSFMQLGVISAGMIMLLGICTVYLVNSTYNPFIYFRF